MKRTIITFGIALFIGISVGFSLRRQDSGIEPTQYQGVYRKILCQKTVVKHVYVPLKLSYRTFPRSRHAELASINRNR